MPTIEPWRRRLRILRAMALLSQARLLVAWVPLERWRDSLGFATDGDGREEAARRFAADIEWVTKRLPFETKCLPRAIALSWLLRRQGIGHAVVIAVRPPELRDAANSLHAWIEVDGATILGELPGPWVETLRIGT